MHKTIGLFAIMWLTITVSESAAPPAAVSVDNLGWLAGCWAYVGDEEGSGEHWTAPAGGTMLGTGRTIRDGRTVSHEFLLIRETEAGGLEYVASPAGQATTVFHLAEADARRLVFANPEHDFPQRIVYHLQNDGTLAARIEGVVSGKERAIDFSMDRAECPDAGTG